MNIDILTRVVRLALRTDNLPLNAQEREAAVRLVDERDAVRAAAEAITAHLLNPTTHLIDVQDLVKLEVLTERLRAALAGEDAKLGEPLDVFRLRIADALGSMPAAVRVSWDGGMGKIGEDLRIVDVTVGGRFRPTRATWQKLIDAGLPMCSWQEASESWDLEAAK